MNLVIDVTKKTCETYNVSCVKYSSMNIYETTCCNASAKVSTIINENLAKLCFKNL